MTVYEVGEDDGGETKHLFASITPLPPSPRGYVGPRLQREVSAAAHSTAYDKTLLLRRVQDDGTYGGGGGGGA